MGKNENIEITRILDIVKSKKLVILCILIIFILLGYFYSFQYVVPKYKAISTLLLIPNSISEGKVIMTSDSMVNADLTVNSGLIETYRSIGENSKVLKQVINNLELDMTEEELLKEMKISVKKETYVIQVEVTNTDPQKAMEIANEFDRVFLKEIKDIYHLDNIGIVDEAQLPEEPYNINHAKDMILFLGIGVVGSVVYLMLVYLFDNTIKKEEEIEKYVQLKSLGSIPMNHDNEQELVNREDAKSYVTECINTIRTNILYMNSTKKAKTILVTSCTPREGKSWVSANIATAFAETDKKVLLIDADMRKGRAHKIFKVNNVEGLSNYLYVMTGEAKKDIQLGKEYIQETKIPNLHILTNGSIPPNPSELLESDNMKDLLELLKNVYDIIIIDAPPCKLVTDSIILSTIVDSTILVASAENTKMNEFNEVKKSIQMVDGEIIGAILNKKKVSGKTYRKGYYYGYTDSKAAEKVEPKEIISVEELIKEAKIEEKVEEIEEVLAEKTKVMAPLEKTEPVDYEKMKNLIHSEFKKLNKVDYVQEMERIYYQLKEDITKVDYTQEMEGIYHQLKEDIEKVDYAQEIEKINHKIEESKLSTNEMINEVIKHNTEELLNTIKNGKDEEQAIQMLLNERVKEMQEETQKLLQEEINKIDYTTQIAQMNEMLTNLKDSYLELSNKIRMNEVTEESSKEEEEKHTGKNIIDFKAFKKQRNKKKVYSIEEDISYEDLEESATYVIPLQKRISGEDWIQDYKNII